MKILYNSISDKRAKNSNEQQLRLSCSVRFAIQLFEANTCRALKKELYLPIDETNSPVVLVIRFKGEAVIAIMV